MSVLRINVTVSGGNGGFAGKPANLTVEAEGNEMFMRAVERAVHEQLGPDRVVSGRLCGIEWYDPEYPEYLHQIAPDGFTMGEAADYFGDEVSAWPPSIRVDDGGYGGAADYIPYIIEGVKLVGLSITAVRVSLMAQRELVKLRYRRFRQLAKDWNDTGDLSQELRDAVYNGSPWERKKFDQTFGLNDSRGPELLRTLGFKRVTEWDGEHWAYNFDQEDERGDALG